MYLNCQRLTEYRSLPGNSGSTSTIYLCVELFGYHTHPDISTGDPNLKVADVGAGTGSAFNKVNKLKSYTFMGFRYPAILFHLLRQYFVSSGVTSWTPCYFPLYCKLTAPVDILNRPVGTVMSLRHPLS